jgi:hypothetical protein
VPHRPPPTPPARLVGAAGLALGALYNMKPALDWAAAHAPELAALAWLALSLLNGSLKYDRLRNGALVQRVVGALMDRLAFLARADSPGTLALPGAASKPPADAPPPVLNGHNPK